MKRLTTIVFFFVLQLTLTLLYTEVRANEQILYQYGTTNPVYYYGTNTPVTLPTTFEHAKQEFRGVWISTIWNLDMPQHTSKEQYQQAYLSILNTLDEYNMNVVLFQVRPKNDAMYPSTLNPWSRFLTGTEGVDPGWDPLAWMIEETHQRGMEFHAWFNPYRVFPDTPEYNIDSQNFAKKHPEYVVFPRDANGQPKLNDAILNPGEPVVQQFILDTVMEVAQNYAIDAVHFDDYFYPYDGMAKELDQEQYQKYNPNQLSLADWRRENVNTVIRSVKEALDAHNTANNRSVQFGVSPFGVWANKSTHPEGSNTQTLESYTSLYADVRKWVQEGWLDYVVPQVYWEFTQSNARYADVVSWWANLVKDTNVNLYIGNSIYRYQETGYNSPAWPNPDELANQFLYNSKYPEVKGSVFFRYKYLANTFNNANLIYAQNRLKNDFYTNKVVTPEIRNLEQVSNPVNELSISQGSSGYQLKWLNQLDARAYYVYRFSKGQAPNFRTMDNVVGVVYPTKESHVSFSDPNGSVDDVYYVTAFNKANVESEPKLISYNQTSACYNNPFVLDPLTVTKDSNGTIIGYNGKDFAAGDWPVQSVNGKPMIIDLWHGSRSFEASDWYIEFENGTRKHFPKASIVDRPDYTDALASLGVLVFDDYGPSISQGTPWGSDHGQIVGVNADNIIEWVAVLYPSHSSEGRIGIYELQTDGSVKFTAYDGIPSSWNIPQGGYVFTTRWLDTVNTNYMTSKFYSFVGQTALLKNMTDINPTICAPQNLTYPSHTLTSDHEDQSKLFVSPLHFYQPHHVFEFMNGERTLDTIERIEITGYDKAGVERSNEIIVTGFELIDWNSPGVYPVTYTLYASDHLGKTEVTVYVTIEATAPQLELKGDLEVTLEVHSDYLEEGATMSDGSTLVIEGQVDPSRLGTYLLKYYAVDEVSGLSSAVQTRTVHVVDTTVPGIELQGEEVLELEQHQSYQEPGAKLSDNYDQNLKLSIEGVVDTSRVGTYTLKYSTMDSSGNRSVVLTRTVRVVNAPIILKPSISFQQGDEHAVIALGTPYQDPQFILENEEVGYRIIRVGEVDVTKVGKYYITYYIQNPDEVRSLGIIREVEVVDPAITIELKGEQEVYLEVGEPYVEQGVRVIYHYFDLEALAIVGEIDFTKVGSYTLTYTKKDQEGNVSNEVTRTIHIVDTTAPHLTGNFSTRSITRGAPFDPIEGITTSDLYEGDLTSQIRYTTSFDLDVPGEYIITLVSTDSSGNQTFAYYKLIVEGETYHINVTFETIIKNWRELAVDVESLNSKRHPYRR